MNSHIYDYKKAENVIKLFTELNIKLIAMDFDATIVDINTARHFTVTATDLAKNHLRPIFRYLIPTILEAKLECCIVTYNWRTKLIRDMLSLAFPYHDTDRVRIEATKKSDAGLYFIKTKIYGKEKHLVNILSRIQSEKNVFLKNNEIFLFDDYQANIAAAVKHSHPNYKVTDNSSLDDISSHIENLIKENNKYDQPINTTHNYLVNKILISNSNIEQNGFSSPQMIMIRKHFS